MPNLRYLKCIEHLYLRCLNLGIQSHFIAKGWGLSCTGCDSPLICVLSLHLLPSGREHIQRQGYSVHLYVNARAVEGLEHVCDVTLSAEPFMNQGNAAALVSLSTWSLLSHLANAACAGFPISPRLQESNKTSPHVTKSISSLLILVS